MSYVRKMQCAAIAAAAVLCLTGTQKLTAAPTNVRYSATGAFATPAINGDDLFNLEGEPFTINITAPTASKPTSRGKGTATYSGIGMNAQVTDSQDPTPFKLHSKTGTLILNTSNTSYDEFTYTTVVTVVAKRITISAVVQMPKGTLNGVAIRAFKNSVTFTDTSNNPNATLTYSGNYHGKKSTELAIASGTFTGK